MVDQYTLDIKTDAPSPILPVLMSTMVAMSPNSPMDEYTRTPAGTGPYRLASWKPGQHIVFERTADYWGPKPEVSKATYITRSESAVRAAMVASGEADLAPMISPQHADNPETDFSYMNSETTKLRIDLTKPPLNDVRIRKALNLAIDREAMLGSIYSDKSVPAAQFVMPSINGFNPKLKVYPYDPKEAQRLVKEARAAGVPVDTEIQLVTMGTGHPGLMEASTAMIEMMKAVGLNVRLQIVEKVDYYKFYFKPFRRISRRTCYSNRMTTTRAMRDLPSTLNITLKVACRKSPTPSSTSLSKSRVQSRIPNVANSFRRFSGAFMRTSWLT